jgi:predicted nucleic acid-binding protein
MRGIILDTNVVSEPRRRAPDPRVRSWFEAQDVDRLYLTTTIISELAVGIERLPSGRKRADFRRWLDALIREDFADRIWCSM